jgi:predicted dehydrogenase/threonine dehydrogenase-like Zn-dependent dehydrogenase
MKQLLQNMRNGNMVVGEVPIPSPRPATALVRTAVSLVSTGTERMVAELAEKSLAGKARSRPDLVRQMIDKARREGLITAAEAVLNRLDQPMPLGYSSAGTIVALGEGLQGYRIGQRVACAGGGYAVHAEYAIVPQNLLVPLPDDVNDEQAAFATLGAIALHGFRLSEAQLGEHVAVIGLGLVGLLCVQLAAVAGCQVLGIDLNLSRVELAKTLGVSAVQRAEAENVASSFNHGAGFDSVIICADTPSADPVVLAGTIARDRARVVAVGAVGLNIPRKIYYEKELAFINSRSYGPGRYDPAYEEKGLDYPLGYVRWTEGRNLQVFIELLSTGRINVQALVTHRYPIEKAPEAYAMILGKRDEPYLGILLTYDQGQQTLPGSTEQIRAQPTRSEERQADTELRPSRVALGVLGAGNYASLVLLPALREIPNLDLVGICSATGLSAQHAANKFGFRYAASDERRVLDDQAINTIAILTRHNLHSRQVVSALQAGKHVFCEKPLALNTEELDEIAGLLTLQPAPLLTVGYNRRFAPLMVRLWKFINDNRREPLAAIIRVNAGYLPPDHWLHDPELGGGRIIGEACHFIDLLNYLVGDCPISVTAGALPSADRYQEDNTVMSFVYPDGSMGTLAYLSNGDRAFPKERVEVFSAGRVAVLDDFRVLETVRDGKRSVSRARLRQDKGQHAEWQAFVHAILSAGEPPIPYRHLLATSRATFAALQALRSGDRVSIQKT